MMLIIFWAIILTVDIEQKINYFGNSKNPDFFCEKIDKTTFNDGSNMVILKLTVKEEAFCHERTRS